MGGLAYKVFRIKKTEQIYTTDTSIFNIETNLITGEKVKIGDLCVGKKCIIVVNVASN